MSRTITAVERRTPLTKRKASELSDVLEQMKASFDDIRDGRIRKAVH
ncbi:MAG: hypothetical protein V1776_05125 [Candidatus Diapherotrites archaeon]